MNNNSDQDWDDKLMEVAIMATAATIMIYTEPLFNKTPYHTSSLSGLGWVCKLLDGHPEHI